MLFNMTVQAFSLALGGLKKNRVIPMKKLRKFKVTNMTMDKNTICAIVKSRYVGDGKNLTFNRESL